MKNIFKQIVSSVLICTTLLQSVVISTAYAVDAGARATQSEMRKGDRKKVTNNSTAMLNNIDSSSVTSRVFDLSQSSPIIWGRYLPELKKGYIQMTSIRKKGYVPDLASLSTAPSKTELEKFFESHEEVLGPDKGIRFARDNSISGFRGTNPFGSFTADKAEYKAIATLNKETLYHDIEFSTFLTAVGMWAQYYSTQRGYVAIAENDQAQYKWEKCRSWICAQKFYHFESNVVTTPRWYVMGSSTNAINRSLATAYKVEECSTKPQVYKGGGSLADSECIATSGSSFTAATNTNDFGKLSETTWHTHTFSTGWNSAFLFIVMAFVGMYMLPTGAFPLGDILTNSAIMQTEITAQGLLSFVPYAELGTYVGATLGQAVAVQGALWTTGYALANVITKNDPSSVLVKNDFLGEALEKLVASTDDSAYGINAFKGAEGDTLWNYAYCLGTGSRAPATYFEQGPGDARRSPRNTCRPGTICSKPAGHACVNWLTESIKDPAKTPLSIYNFYNSRSHNIERDYQTTNEVKRMIDTNKSPLRSGGDAERK